MESLYSFEGSHVDSKLDLFPSAPPEAVTPTIPR